MKALPIPANAVVVDYPGNVKRCSRCREVKPLDSYTRQLAKSNGGKGNVVYLRRCSQCFECRRLTNREHYDRVGRVTKRARDRKASERRVNRELPKLMPERSTVALLHTVAICVCGALRSHHKGFVGACVATGCAEYFERGK